jgi:hypothetical protein
MFRRDRLDFFNQVLLMNPGLIFHFSVLLWMQIPGDKCGSSFLKHLFSAHCPPLALLALPGSLQVKQQVGKNHNTVFCFGSFPVSLRSFMVLKDKSTHSRGCYLRPVVWFPIHLVMRISNLRTMEPRVSDLLCGRCLTFGS